MTSRKRNTSGRRAPSLVAATMRRVAGALLNRAMPVHGMQLRGHVDFIVPKGVFADTGRFGRLFPQLRSLKEAQLSISPEDLGRHGGPMDGGSGLDPEQNNPRLTAGFTFLGQFLDHDITFDPTSSLEQQNDPGAIRNFRTPAFELDSVYGAGPSVQPYLFDSAGRFLTSEDGGDLIRNAPGAAIIADPRNDENLIISQLHLAFQRFHNAVLEKHAGGDFEEAQRLVRWHYQWIVLHEFLPLTVGEEVVDDVVAHGRRFFRFGGEAFMPVEFSVAAYRFGHSQVRPGYRVNANFAGALFPGQPNAPFEGGDLRGGRPVPPERKVDWTFFFGSDAQAGRLIDTRISTPLLRLPDTVVPPGTPDERRSLAIRNMRRALAFAIPSGQTISRFMCIPELGDEELWTRSGSNERITAPDGRQASGPAPLWFYILREAERRAKGQHLHGVGARIVAEVFIGLLQADQASFLNHDPCFTPTLPSAKPGTFTMRDLLTLAGV